MVIIFDLLIENENAQALQTRQHPLQRMHCMYHERHHRIRKSLFLSFHIKRRPCVFNIHSGDPFLKSSFLVPERAVYMSTDGQCLTHIGPGS